TIAQNANREGIARYCAGVTNLLLDGCTSYHRGTRPRIFGPEGVRKGIRAAGQCPPSTSAEAETVPARGVAQMLRARKEEVDRIFGIFEALYVSDKATCLHGEDEPYRNCPLPLLEGCFQGEPVKGIVDFDCLKFTSVPGKHLRRWKTRWIKIGNPVLVMPARCADVNRRSADTYRARGLDRRLNRCQLISGNGDGRPESGQLYEPPASALMLPVARPRGVPGSKAHVARRRNDLPF